MNSRASQLEAAAAASVIRSGPQAQERVGQQVGKLLKLLCPAPDLPSFPDPEGVSGAEL